MHPSTKPTVAVAHVRTGLQLLGGLVKEADRHHTWAIGRFTGNEDGRIQDGLFFRREMTKFLRRYSDPTLKSAVRSIYELTRVRFGRSPPVSAVDAVIDGLTQRLNEVAGKSKALTPKARETLGPMFNDIVEFSARYHDRSFHDIVTGY